MTPLKLISLDDVVVFPGMPVTLPADVGRRYACAAHPAARQRLRQGRRGRRGVGAGRRRRPRPRLVHGAPPRRARRGPHRPRRRPARRGRRAPGRRAAAEPDPRARARVSRGGRGNSRAARRRWPDQRVRALDHPSGRAGGYRRLLAGSERRPEARAARNARRRRTADSWPCSFSRTGWPSCASASASATTSRPARRNSSASTSCAGRWTRSARSSARTRVRSPRNIGRRLRPPGCPRRCSSRPSASWRDSSGWATRTPKRR